MTQPAVGDIFEGKVTGITKFGAFVALPDGKSGLVHISEIANTYVSDVSQFLSEGQTVKVKVIGIGDGGKINLSIKKLEEQPRAQQPQFRQNAGQPRAQQPSQQPQQQARPFTRAPRPAAPAAEPSFEDKLKQFMQESDSRMAGNKLYDRRSSSRRRRD